MKTREERESYEDYLNEQAQEAYEEGLAKEERENTRESNKIRKKLSKKTIPYAIRVLAETLDKTDELYKFYEELKLCELSLDDLEELMDEDNGEFISSGNSDCVYSCVEEYIENWASGTEYFCKFKGKYYDLSSWTLYE